MDIFDKLVIDRRVRIVI